LLICFLLFHLQFVPCTLSYTLWHCYKVTVCCMKPCLEEPTLDQPTFSNSTGKATSVDNSSPHVNEPTEDTTNKVVTSADSTSRIYSYAPPQTL
jgi:hypothetical protein